MTMRMLLSLLQLPTAHSYCRLTGHRFGAKRYSKSSLNVHRVCGFMQNDI